MQRYAARFDAVEINSTFYRSHRPDTYARWREGAPEGFRFAVKLPRAITHEARLIGVEDRLAAFRAEASQLGDKLGPLLVQLPPSLAFSPDHEGFFTLARALWPQAVVCEPRHPSWFEAEAEALLAASGVARVAADPSPHPAAARPGGWSDIAYWRLHGSPRMYFTPYDEAALAKLAHALRGTTAQEIWCVFDNTASGAAAANALALEALLSQT